MVKTVIVFSLLVICVISQPQGDRKDERLVLSAINGAIKTYFLRHEPKVDLFFIGSYSEKLAGKIILESPKGITFRLIRLDSALTPQITFPSILLYDSADSYKMMAMFRLKPPADIIWYNRLVYIANNGESEIFETFKYLKMCNENENFLKVVNHSTVDLVTNIPYGPGRCNTISFETINRFSLDNMTWHNETFYPEKYRDYHNCSLKIQYQEDFSSDASREVFEILGKKFNFRVNRFEVDNVLKSPIVDFTECIGYQIAFQNGIYLFSHPFYSDSLTYTVPAGEPYTQLEKMFVVFDKETWICIAITLVGSFLVIQVINRLSTAVQNFVFGRHNQTPSLNLASIFLNGSQFGMPSRNFARFFLILFIFWCLIIRTCYQSELYKNLQRDMRKPRIASVDELNEKNFTLIRETMKEHYHLILPIDVAYNR